MALWRYGEAEKQRLHVLSSDDFRFLEDAVEWLGLNEMKAKAGSVLSHQLFSSTRAKEALFRFLGMKPSSWNCRDERFFPPACAETGVGQDNAASLDMVQKSASLRMFYRYCTGCQRGDKPAPPNRFSSDPASVESRLRQWAPRIF